MQTLLQFYYRWLARRRLINRYLYLIEVNKLLEGYITKKILDGGSQEFLAKTREELVKNQQDSRENANFITFLRTKTK